MALAVVLIGTFDTKGAEYAYLRDRLHERGADVILVDAGVQGQSTIEADVSRATVARAAGVDRERLGQEGDRAAALEAMAHGAAAIACDLLAQQRLDAILGLGGSGGSSIVSAAMRALPIGIPKLLISTLASGDTRPYVGASDLVPMAPVADMAGLNRLTRPVLDRAVGAILGMATAVRDPDADDGSLVAATMFGVTTPCVTRARERLEELGHEVVPFHATGVGGAAMEGLIQAGRVTAVLDVTTTELADDLVGGIASAGPTRLEAAGAAGVPQVVAPGAMDMVNFGAIDTVPEAFRGRTLYQHNEAATLLRTSAEECAELGRRLAAKLNAARGPVALFLPLRGVSSLSTEGRPFHDPVADEALFAAAREAIDDGVRVEEVDADINDAAFAERMAETLHALCAADGKLEG